MVGKSGDGKIDPDESFSAKKSATKESDIIPKKVASKLISALKAYDPDFNEERIIKAVDIAIEYHGTQKRHSGDPYYHHPIAVAEILTECKLDEKTILTAILHDTVEDTDLTIEEINEKFGADIGALVDGVTKLTKIEFQSDNERQAENFRKFLLAISEDVRVLMVKLADRLHNMRTLHYINKDAKRHRIAHETMEIYAPLAERIGMQNIKDELQYIAFKELNPEGYKSVISRLEFLRKSGEEIVEQTVVDIEKILKDEGLEAEISGREKRPYSIWRKMQDKNITFEQLSDIIAFRILTDSKENCYRALGVIHSKYHMVPDNFKDFISTPKNNGYRSLHTVVIGPGRKPIEIQIRTRKMHEIAEMGVAAHWSYKQGVSSDAMEGKKFRWMRELLDILEHTSNPDEVLENTKLEMYHDQVFCFSPKGDLYVLPKGGTTVDFAFAVHSEVGSRCVGAKVNGRIAPLRTRLKNGDQVEILTSKSQNPSAAWEHFVVTGKARSEIKRFVRSQKYDEYRALGEEMIKRSIISEGEKYNAKMIEPLVEKFKKESIEDIFISIGDGTLSRQDVLKELFPEKFSERKKPSLLSRFRTKNKEGYENHEKISVPIMGLIPGMAVHFAGCCHPLPGEKITGIVNSGKGVTIHTVDCGELENFVDHPERWIDVGWEGMASDDLFVGRIKTVVSHQKGALALITSTIAQAEGNINNLRITNRSTDFFEIIVDIEVRDIDHLASIINVLRSKKMINEVERYKEGHH